MGEVCGRFALFSSKQKIQDQYQLSWDGEMSQRYNIAPTQSILAIIQDDAGERKARWFRWGLIPFWAKESSIGSRLINARGETVDQKPSFRHLLKRKRCLILVNGFFEWKKQGNQKQPYFIRCNDRELFSFAGLWDFWKTDEQAIYSCTIITTEANELMKPIHQRMPVILDQEQEKQWLDHDITNREWLKSLLMPFDEKKMELYPVSTLVNNPQNDQPNTIKPTKV